MKNCAVMGRNPPRWRLVKNAFNNSNCLVVGIRYSVTQQQTHYFAFTTTSSNRLDKKRNLNENGFFSFSFLFEAD